MNPRSRFPRGVLDELQGALQLLQPGLHEYYNIPESRIFTVPQKGYAKMGSKKRLLLSDSNVTQKCLAGDLTVGTPFSVPLLWDGEIHPVSITRFPLRRFSPGAGLLRNPFVHR